MDKKEKIANLTIELEKLKEKYQHILTEYSATKEGSAYGVEYYEIQIKVLDTMMQEIRMEILNLRKIAEN